MRAVRGSQTEKFCRACERTLPAASFNRVKSGRKVGMLRHPCKECAADNCRAYAIKNHERVLTVAKAGAVRRMTTDQGRARRRVASQAWKKANREKIKAEAAAYVAIRAGRLVPKPCERCGTTDKLHAHHERYQAPLDVTWLCTRCHGERHREINEARRAAARQQRAA